MQDVITLSTDCGSSTASLIFPYRDSPKMQNVRAACNGKPYPCIGRPDCTAPFAPSDCTHHRGHRTVCMPDRRLDSL